METTTLRETIATHLRIVRELKGLSPEEVSAKTDNEISPSYIRRLEKGENSPTVETLYLICEAYETTIGKFFASMKM